MLGDSNTRFFFKCAKERKARNEIKALKNGEDNWVTNEADIQQAFKEYFLNLFNPPPDPNFTNASAREWLHLTPKLTDSHLLLLNKPFSDEEIRKAAFSMKPNKSLGPKGIPPVFIPKNWHLLGKDICEAVHSFFSNGHMLSEMNKTYITLIPKKDKPENVTQFRPISLCNSTYKIISKCMVGRLKAVIRDIDGDFQNVFIPCRLM